MELHHACLAAPIWASRILCIPKLYFTSLQLYITSIYSYPSYLLASKTAWTATAHAILLHPVWLKSTPLHNKIVVYLSLWHTMSCIIHYPLYPVIHGYRPFGRVHVISVRGSINLATFYTTAFRACSSQESIQRKKKVKVMPLSVIRRQCELTSEIDPVRPTRFQEQRLLEHQSIP